MQYQVSAFHQTYSRLVLRSLFGLVLHYSFVFNGVSQFCHNPEYQGFLITENEAQKFQYKQTTEYQTDLQRSIHSQQLTAQVQINFTVLY